MNNLKKLVAGATLFGMLVAVPVSGTSADDLADQIAALQAQLNELLAQYQTMTGTPAAGIPTTCAGVTFTRDLSEGSDGSDVKCLQALLNTDVATQVASTGVGSANNETNYFGSLTSAAVVKFQNKYAAEILTPLGLSAGTGYVGASTRAKLNSMLTTPVTPTDPEPTDPEPTDPEPTDPVVEGSEGSFTATIAASPASNANLTTLTDASIYGIDIKAIGSDMTVERVDLRMAVTKTKSGSTVTVHPGTIVKNLSFYDGSTLLTEKAVSTSDFLKDSSSNYWVRVSGLGFEIPEDSTKTLTVKADFYENLETNRTLTVRVQGTSGIRAVDTLGLNSWDTLNTLRTHTVKYATTGTSSLSAVVSTSTPDAATVNVDSTDGVTGVEMLLFDVKSTVGDSKITDVTIDATGTAVTDEMDSISLYDGTELIQSVAVSGDSAAFSDLEIEVGEGVTKTLTAKADFNSSAKGTATLSIAVDGITYEQPDLSTSKTPSTTAITGQEMNLYKDAVANFTLVSAEIDKSGNSTNPSLSTMEGVFKITVEADGGTVTKFPTTTDAVVTVKAYDENDVETTANFSSFVSQSPDKNISDGGTATITVSTSLQKNDRSGFYYFKITSIAWEAVGTTPNSVTQTWGLDEFVTDAISW
jgi:hypothetical protein